MIVPGTKLETDFILKGASATLTFAQEGIFNHNALHPNMKGSVEVKNELYSYFTVQP